jgi:Fe2+ or Zn2+ uptake regulation protein
MVRLRDRINKPNGEDGYMARSDQQKKILICLHYAKRVLSINQIAQIIDGRDNFKLDWQEKLVLDPVRQSSIWRSLERLIEQKMVRRSNPHSPSTRYSTTEEGDIQVARIELSYEEWKQHHLKFQHIKHKAENIRSPKPDDRSIVELMDEKRVVVLGSRKELKNLIITFIPRTDPHGEQSAILRCKDAIRNAHEVWVYDQGIGSHTKRDIVYAKDQEKSVLRIRQLPIDV